MTVTATFPRTVATWTGTVRHRSDRMVVAIGGGGARYTFVRNLITDEWTMVTATGRSQSVSSLTFTGAE